MAPKNKLILLLFETCNRNCEGRCNKDFDLANLPLESDFSRYKKVFLTGGEPMLKPDLVLKTVEEIRRQSNAKIILYTAKVDDLKSSVEVLKRLDGVTLTLHEQGDVGPFRRLDTYLLTMFPRWAKEKSYRLNVFRGIKIRFVSEQWVVKSNVEWIKHCPLPDGETFKRLDINVLRRKEK